MSNSYDAQDLDQQRDQQRMPRASVSEAADIRSRLTINLHNSITEAQNLITLYDNLIRQLELCVAAVETKK